MFVDRARIRVVGGNGGNGCVSFRREKYVPKGGPNGGDGGKGGDLYLVASERTQSLLDFRYNPLWRGNRGRHGEGSDCHGRSGEDREMRVPPGTVVRDAETGAVLADLAEAGARFLAAHGGKGGKGNARFATSTHRVPRFAEKGEPGEAREYLLELKLIAEIGLVGLPNAGKSTLLASISAAHPKVADYPFTTLSPNLGVAELSGFRTLTVADIPGIIEGAAEGKGLGHDFLRHIERTKVLLFLLDLGDADPAATYAVLDRELNQHSAAFAKRPRLIALNKADVTENRERCDTVKADFDRVHIISGVTGEGVPQLLEAAWQALEAQREAEAARAQGGPPPEREIAYNYEAPFEIARTSDGFEVTGQRVLRAVRMTDFENEQAVRHLHDVLSKMGLFKALKRLHAKDGASIHIGDFDLEYHPD
ncbi:MAG: GTPase ObgE [Candidatus Hydrogenedentota bacterium]